MSTVSDMYYFCSYLKGLFYYKTCLYFSAVPDLVSYMPYGALSLLVGH